jgi:hypothetical protein
MEFEQDSPGVWRQNDKKFRVCEMNHMIGHGVAVREERGRER